VFGKAGRRQARIGTEQLDQPSVRVVQADLCHFGKFA